MSLFLTDSLINARVQDRVLPALVFVQVRVNDISQRQVKEADSGLDQNPKTH